LQLEYYVFNSKLLNTCVGKVLCFLPKVYVLRWQGSVPVELAFLLFLVGLLRLFPLGHLSRQSLPRGLGWLVCGVCVLRGAFLEEK
jgi:hypothetical protein